MYKENFGLKHKQQNLSTSSFDLLDHMDLIVKGCLSTIGCLAASFASRYTRCQQL